MLHDLARLAADLGGADSVRALNDDERLVLRRAVQRSRMTVVADSRTDQLRSLRVDVRFSTRARSQLRKALGPYRGAQLELLLRYEPIKRLRVAPSS